MQEKIHPKYYQTTVRCSCGESFATGSTKRELKVEVCSKCHPFFTGIQKIVDTTGQIEKFHRRMSKVNRQPVS
ncbi:MAG: 50S ribosomal protein L31 [Carboxydocellales bacterium]